MNSKGTQYQIKNDVKHDNDKSNLLWVFWLEQVVDGVDRAVLEETIHDKNLRHRV